MARALVAFLACLGWADAAIGQGAYVGGAVSIARGADGLGLISYYDYSDGDLKVAHCSNALCTQALVTRLDGMNGGHVGSHTAIAIGSDGLGLIAYFDADLRDLKVAHCSDVRCTSATIARVDTAGQAGTNLSLAIGADGRGLISYDSEGGPVVGVRVAHCEDVACSSALVSTVDSLGGLPGGLITGTDGLGLLTYTRGGELWMAHCDNAACTATTRTSLVTGTAAALTLGADGLGLAAHRFSNGDLAATHCANALCTSATSTTRLDTLYFEARPAVALGADGLGLISYADSSTHLKVAHCSDAGCTAVTATQLELVDFTGSSSAVAIGGDGLGLIAYSDGLNGYLKVAHCSDAACTTATLSILDGLPPDPELLAGRTSLAKGADGLGLISYWDSAAGDLKVAHCSDLECSRARLSRLDTAGVVGEYSSLAIGTDGLGLISYYDATNGDLKVAHCSDVLCTAATATTLDSTGDVGRHTSLAIGTDGRGLISYQDVTNDDLKVAHCADTACTAATLSTVDAASIAVRDTNLEIGGDSLGLITYVRNYSTLVAHCRDQACTSATLTPSGSNFAVDVSHTIGPDGLGLVAYADAFPGEERSVLYRCANADCSSSSPGYGFFPYVTEMSLAIGSDGLPLLSHRSVGSLPDLVVAHCTDSQCLGYTRAVLDRTGDVGKYSSLAIGADGLGLIAYWDATEGWLKAAHCLDLPCSSARISVLDGGARFYALTPCRAVDTRPSASPLLANVTRTFALGGTCGIPADARAVAVNAVAVNPSESGNLRLFGTGQPEPYASVLNFAAGRTRANNGVVALGRDGQVDARCDLPAGSTGQTHFVLDVFGYFK